MGMNIIQAERLSSKAQKLMSRNQAANALLLLEKAAQLSPDNPRILIPYSQALAREGRIEESEKQILHAESAAPKNPCIRLFLGILYYDQKRFQDALDSFETCLKKQPSNQLARNFRALTLFALGRKMEAIQALKNEHLEHHIPLLSRLCALLELEIHKSASMPGERESDLFSEKPESPAQPSSPGDKKPLGYFAGKKMMRTAIKALNNKDYDAALRLFHTLLSQDPDNPTAAFGLVISLTEKGLYEEARDILIHYLDRKKGSPEPALVAWLGRLYILLGRYECGVSLLKSLSVEGPVDYNINYHLALGYLFPGKTLLAFHYFDRAFRYYYVDTLEDCLLPLVQKAGDHIASS
jgi:predicted Zn-dependent protease